MNIHAPIILCFIMYATVFIVMALLVPNLKLRHELLASVLGLLSVLPIAFIEYIALSFSFNIVLAVVLNGLIEEMVKLLIMMPLPYKKLDIAPFFAISVLCGLILGSFESVIYFLVQLQKIGMDAQNLQHLIMLRIFSAALIHSFCAGLSGLCLWSCRKKIALLPFILAVLLHSLYNFFAGLSSNERYFSIAVILLAMTECRVWYKSLNKR